MRISRKVYEGLGGGWSIEGRRRKWRDTAVLGDGTNK